MGVASGHARSEERSSWRRVPTMEHFVHLEALPGGLQFPAELRDKIRYDDAAQRLCYRGFMSKVDFDRLNYLSDDWSYRRQLEELFRLCTPEEPGRAKG